MMTSVKCPVCGREYEGGGEMSYTGLDETTVRHVCSVACIGKLFREDKKKVKEAKE